MPKGVYKRKDAEGATPSAEVVAPVRTRETLNPDQYTKDFLSRNRPNLAGFEQQLAYFGEHPGWVRRWAVDQGNRIQFLLERGWRFVLRDEVGMSDSVGHGNTDIGDRVSISTTAGEGRVRQYLMETTEQLYQMQCDAALDPVRRTESAIREGAFQVNDTEHVYQPKGITNRVEQKTVQ